MYVCIYVNEHLSNNGMIIEIVGVLLLIGYLMSKSVYNVLIYVYIRWLSEPASLYPEQGI